MASWGLAVLGQRMGGTGDPCMLVEQAKVPEDPDGEFFVEAEALNKETFESW